MGLWADGFWAPGFWAPEFWQGLSPNEPPEILTESLPNTNLGANYSQTIQVSGTGPMTFALIGGTLPPGLSLNTSTGVISGVPTLIGTYNFTVRVTGAVGQAQQTYSVRVTVFAEGGALTTMRKTTLDHV